MTRKLTTLFATTAILGGFLLATTGFANETTTSPQPTHGTTMMGDHEGMMSMMGQMSPAQMARMIDNCHRMAGSTNNTPTDPDNKATPDHRG
jgi:hypothetical protein